MSRRILGVLLGAAFLTAGLPFVPRSSVAAPEPSRVAVSWELNFKYGSMDRVYVTIDGKQMAYWYMRYTVINNSGRDVLFTPSFEIVANTGTVQAAFKETNGKDNIPNAVFEKIKEVQKNRLLQSPNGIYGKLLQGEDNARDGVIIFPAFEPDAREFQLFVMGLSGETAEVKNPVSGKPVILQKTLELDLRLPGQAIAIEPKTEVIGMKWVMK